MRWQRVAQAAIALLVIGFIAILVTSLRRERAGPPQQPPQPREDPTAAIETPGGIDFRHTDASGRVLFAVKAGKNLLYPDGRNVLAGGVQITTNRDGRNLVMTADNGEFMPEEGDVKWASFRGHVRLTTDGGVQVDADEARYTKDDGLVTIPGRVQFAKGRMKGSGVNATYDQNRDVVWVREQARVDVAAGPDGQGALEATAGAIGLARSEHYIQLQKDARITGGGRIAQADDITVRLTDDDERIRMLELRGNSRITGSGGGTQSMAARDIDMTYAADGKTLQQAKLVENAVVELPGAGSAGPRRVAGTTIDIGLGSDGSTVTSLAANDRVQVDLPAEGAAPAKTIRSASLTAAGADGTGLVGATFGGGVEYREGRAASRNAPALDRTATSQTLVVNTKPGLGAVEKADFRGNVKFVEAPDFVAESQQGIYDITRDRLHLTPAEGQPGPVSPTVTDNRVSVAARTIHFSLSTREMTAETRVRSTIRPQKSQQRGGNAQGRLPSMLAQDEPVNVTSDRLAYEGAGAAAVYSGNVTLWQGVDTRIKAATITIDDKTGNLTASGNAVTTFAFEDTNRKAGTRKRELTTGSSETFTYDDAARLATYTGKAQIRGPQGDVNGEKIELFMKAGTNELERAEAYGANGQVQVREGNRIAKGSHLTYTASDDRYLMIGTPVEVIEEEKGTCTRTLGAKVTFNRATERVSVDGSDTSGAPMQSQKLKACPAGLIR